MIVTFLCNKHTKKITRIKSITAAAAAAGVAATTMTIVTTKGKPRKHHLVSNVGLVDLQQYVLQAGFRVAESICNVGPMTGHLHHLKIDRKIEFENMVRICPYHSISSRS